MEVDKATWLKECREACKRIKYLSDELQWSERPNHSGWLEATSALLDDQRVTLPRLLFRGEYRAGKMGERITYGLMYREQREMRRVFMLEVYPKHERSHFENGVVFFGPHIHLGDPRLDQITRSVHANLDGPAVRRWIERFRRHARIMDNDHRQLGAPFSGDLFG